MSFPDSDFSTGLARILFEQEAIYTQQIACNLLFVPKDAWSWIGPLLYSTLSLGYLTKCYLFAGCLTPNDNLFFIRNIRELRISTSPCNGYLFTCGIFTSDILAGIDYPYLQMGMTEKTESAENTFVQLP